MEQRFETFTVLITAISRSIRRIKTGEMEEFELKSPHVSCLYYLYKRSALTSKELCDICDEDKANISRSIEYLEKNGYLVCLSTAQKRYRSPLELTEKGKQVASIIAEKIDCMLKEASVGVSDEDRAVMYRSLDRINKNLQNICEKYI